MCSTLLLLTAELVSWRMASTAASVSASSAKKEPADDWRFIDRTDMATAVCCVPPMARQYQR